MKRRIPPLVTDTAGYRSGCRPVKRKGFLPKAITLAVASCFATEVAIANPNGFAVVNGQATFNYNGQILTITNTPGSIINWQSFSITQNEITRFIQQSAASSVLNRVIGIDPSIILGALQSNGRVFLINPNGILFGAGAQIDVAGLVASTLNLSNGDFLAGRLRFTDTPGAGSLVNQGAITTPSGGQVYLIAPNVQNTGIITSPQGEIILAAGRSVELVDAGTPGLRVEITAPDSEALNVGQIVANSGRIGIYAGLIRNSGVIRADGVVVGQNGEILLKATGNTTLDAGSILSASGAEGGKITIQSGDTTLLSGTVEAKGSEGAGGTMQVLGNLVGLTGNTTIDASGQTGGGTILVGGDYQGHNLQIQNARRTYFGPDAIIRADAIGTGNGGKVILWSDDATRAFGTISAKGGAGGGNGGFVETSAHWINLNGLTVDTRAPAGNAGNWLIDPTNLTIDNTADVNVNITSPFAPQSAATSTLTWATITGAGGLGGGNTTVTTVGTPANAPDDGTITIAAGTSYNSANSLSFNAAGGVIVNGGVTNTGTGALNFTAGSDMTVNGVTVSTAGSMNLNLTGGLSLLAGSTLGEKAELISGAGQTINAKFVEVIAQANNYATLRNNSGIQTITTSGMNGAGEGILVRNLGGTTNLARIYNNSAGAQTITVNDADKLVVDGAGASARILANGNQTVLVTGATSANAIEVGSVGASGSSRIEGQSQQITAGNPGEPGSITLQGPDGANKVAFIENTSGSQTISAQNAILLTGGAAPSSAGFGTQILNSGAGLQTINAASITLQGGSGGTNNIAWINSNGGGGQSINTGSLLLQGGSGTDASARLTATLATGSPTQVITVTGTTTLQGGDGTGSFAGIGRVSGDVDIQLNGAGNITLTGGSGSGAFAGIGAFASGYGGDVTINGGANVTLNKGTTGSMADARIGSVDGPGTIVVSAPSGSISLNDGLIFTTGTAELVARWDISQGAAGVITADKLLAKSTSGEVLLDTATNQVNTLAGTADGRFNFKNGRSLTIGDVGSNSGVSAGGYSGSFNITVTSGDLTVASPVSASGYEGGGASVTLTTNSGTIYVNNNVSASSSSWGMASVSLNATSGNIEINNSRVSAYGLSGASVSLNAVASANPLAGNITVTDSRVSADGRTASITMIADGTISVSGRSGSNCSSSSSACGLHATGRWGLPSASIKLSAGTGITIDNTDLHARASSGSANVRLRTLTGNIDVKNNSAIMADGGEGAIVTLNAPGGDIFVDTSRIAATSTWFRDASVTMNAGGTISISNSIGGSSCGSGSPNACGIYATSASGGGVAHQSRSPRALESPSITAP